MVAEIVRATTPSSVIVRPWQDGDLARLRNSEALYSADTYFRRFLTGGRRLPPHYIDALRDASLRGDRWKGQVAIDGERLVAVAECTWDPADRKPPDLAVMVADTWQGRGIGRLVLHQLMRRCIDAGLTVFSAEYLAVNRRVRPLVDSVAQGLPEGVTVGLSPSGGIHELTIRVSDPAGHGTAPARSASEDARPRRTRGLVHGGDRSAHLGWAWRR